MVGGRRMDEVCYVKCKRGRLYKNCYQPLAARKRRSFLALGLYYIKGYTEDIHILAQKYIELAERALLLHSHLELRSFAFPIFAVTFDFIYMCSYCI